MNIVSFFKTIRLRIDIRKNRHKMTREERYKKFNEIKNNFEKNINLIKCHFDTDKYDKLYQFNIYDGLHSGVENNNLLYKYGTRICNIYIDDRVDDCNFSTSNKVRDWGASLSYNLIANGKVVVILRPAGTENFECNETYIILGWFSPENINYRLLYKHFKVFYSYMNITSLDGIPSLYDKFIIFWIKFTRIMMVNKKFEERKITQISFMILKYVLTVGMSGGVLFLLERLIRNDVTPCVHIFYL